MNGAAKNRRRLWDSLEMATIRRDFVLTGLVEDYINRTVTIACNRETGMVVVIG